MHCLNDVETTELKLTIDVEKLVDEYGERDDERSVETLRDEPLVLPRKRRPVE